MSKKTKEVAPSIDYGQGLVINTDGGSRPNPGPAGYGIHGYLYALEKPKKGIGLSGTVTTVSGYQDRASLKDDKSDIKDYMPIFEEKKTFDKPYEVRPIHYVDGLGTLDGDATNNAAEIEGAYNGLLKAREYDIKVCSLYTDSAYVVNSMTKGWAEKWKANNWLKPDGTPVPNANAMQRLMEVRDQLVQRGVALNITWNKGHAGHLGNELADNAATLAVMMAQRLRQKGNGSNGTGNFNLFVTSEPEDYWKTKKHPFLMHRKLYFNTQPEACQPGVYYLGEVGDAPDEFIGMKIADGSFSVIRIQEPNAEIEMAREKAIQIARNTDYIAMARLAPLLEFNAVRQLRAFGQAALVQKTTERLDLVVIDSFSGNEIPVVDELNPPRLAFRAVSALSDLALKLDQYEEGNHSFTITDLTPILYVEVEAKGKKGEKTLSLKPEYNVGYAALKVLAKYAGDREAEITLTLGIDMLDRNSLKRIESERPKVHLITWMEDENSFRYATIVTCGQDRGIWAGVHSNVRYLANKT